MDEATRRGRAWSRLFTLMEDERYRHYIEGMLMHGHDTETVEKMIESALEWREQLEEAKRRSQGG
jgi:hypothetical protein